MRIHKILLLALPFIVALPVSVTLAQAPSTNAHDALATYDLRRETNIVGTVVTYSTDSPNLSPGAHVALKTTSGIIDVHLGDSRFLAANHFAIQPGDTLRVIGEPVAHGDAAQFLVRIIQKGTQALTVRSVRGFPLSYVAPRDGTRVKAPGAPL